MNFDDVKKELQHWFDTMDPYRVTLFAAEWQAIPDVSQALYEIEYPKIRDSFF